MMEKILECPLIKDNNQIVSYGGNQDWFKDPWAKKAGCASVSAMDIYTYYTSDETVHEKQLYLKGMEDMFSLMTPKNMGFPYAYLYARKLHHKLAENNIFVNYKVHRVPDTDVAIHIVKKAIVSGNPLGLLILKHRRWKLRHDIWHWVTIFGYRYTSQGCLIIFSDCGEKKEIPARILFEKHCLVYFKLVQFDKQ